MKVEIEHITAVNGYVRLAFIKLDNELYGVRISNILYEKLKKQGIPTGQKLRYQNAR